MSRRQARRLGLKRRLVTMCRDGHVWYRTYGDVRLHADALYVCEMCRARTDDPDDSDIVVDPTQWRIDVLRNPVVND